LESEEKKIGRCFGGIKNENSFIIYFDPFFICFLEYVNEGGQVRSGQVIQNHKMGKYNWKVKKKK
jgi:hypothetical protein